MSTYLNVIAVYREDIRKSLKKHLDPESQAKREGNSEKRQFGPLALLGEYVYSPTKRL
jgi:hypothetical protein